MYFISCATFCTTRKWSVHLNYNFSLMGELRVNYGGLLYLPASSLPCQLQSHTTHANPNQGKMTPGCWENAAVQFLTEKPYCLLNSWQCSSFDASIIINCHLVWKDSSIPNLVVLFKKCISLTFQLLSYQTLILGVLTSHKARECGNTGSKNGRNCSNLLISVHLHLMGFLLLALTSNLSQPLYILDLTICPWLREAQLGCLCSESTYVEGGTPEDGWQYSFS